MKKKIFLVVCLVLLFLAALYFYKHYPNRAVNIYEVHRVGDKRLYLDTNLTPGDVFLNISEKDVCRPGYAASVRKVPRKLRKLVFKEYYFNDPLPKNEIEVDHFIPLELGGSNDIKNLWIELASPYPGFHEKDLVENYLHREVCKEKMPLKEAQEKIKKDWYAIYLNIRK